MRDEQIVGERELGMIHSEQDIRVLLPLLLGATLSLRVGDETMTRRLRTSTSYCSASDARIHIGLGDHAHGTGGLRPAR